LAVLFFYFIIVLLFYLISLILFLLSFNLFYGYSYKKAQTQVFIYERELAEYICDTNIRNIKYATKFTVNEFSSPSEKVGRAPVRPFGNRGKGGLDELLPEGGQGNHYALTGREGDDAVVRLVLTSRHGSEPKNAGSACLPSWLKANQEG